MQRIVLSMEINGDDAAPFSGSERKPQPHKNVEKRTY